MSEMVCLIAYWYVRSYTALSWYAAFLILCKLLIFGQWVRWSVLLRLDMCALVPLCLDMQPLPCSENGYAATFYQMGSTAHVRNRIHQRKNFTGGNTIFAVCDQQIFQGEGRSKFWKENIIWKSQLFVLELILGTNYAGCKILFICGVIDSSHWMILRFIYGGCEFMLWGVYSC